jgi:hypothetical protein
MLVLLAALSAYANDQAPPPPAVEPAAKPPKEWSLAGLPIANFSTDTGVGYGLYGTVVHNNASPESSDPYRARVALQFFQTTKKYQDHNLKVDFPGIFGSKYRYDLLVGYEAWKQATYYGYGNLSPRQPLADADLCREEPREIPEGSVCADYYQFDVRWWRVLTNLRRDIGGPWQVFGQYMFRAATVDSYEGSLFAQDVPVGEEGGLYGRLGAGVMYDTRDQEPSPTSGVFAEASARVSSPVVGSRWTVFGGNVTVRHWHGFGGESKPLVFANRVVLDAKRGDEPFFSAQLLGGSQFVEVGGSNNLRGLPNSRFRGDVFALWTPELRWTYAHWGPLDWMLVPYFDVGRVFLWKDSPALSDGYALPDDQLLHLHYTAGLGARFQLGTNMLVRLDTAFGAEEYGLGNNVTEVKPNFGFYLVFDHPF